MNSISSREIRLKTFERGVGWTSSCGSGAIATAFVAQNKGITKIIHDGGASFVELLDEFACLTTCPQIVFEGSWHG
jgi:diaminopimelate epimerase